MYKVRINAVQGSTEVLIKSIQFDSRKISKGDVFVAIKGTVVDGHNFINDVIAKGAIAVVCEKTPENTVQDVTYIEVDSASKALAFIASNYYNVPSENLKLVGITGTNGKTTIASLLYQLFKKAGFKVGLLSTVKVKTSMSGSDEPLSKLVLVIDAEQEASAYKFKF